MLIGRETPLSLLMVDLDHFKSYNDEFGHPAGDVLIAKVGCVVTPIPGASAGFLQRDTAAKNSSYFCPIPRLRERLMSVRESGRQ